jgi:hypothetical protein
MTSEFNFDNEYLTKYLDLVDDTESPRLFHVWAALSAMSCAMGRRLYLPFGSGHIYGNQYILLVGNPATRKTTTLSIGRKLLLQSCNTRFAPTDTSGLRQGLVTAMRPPEPSKDAVEERDELEAELARIARQGMSLHDLTASNTPAIPVIDTTLPMVGGVAWEDRHHMAAYSAEFGQLIGQNNTQLLDFLTSMWDGEDYIYQTKNEVTKLDEPLLNILACTTPASIAVCMPSSAEGQGILSRFILVFGSEKHKKLPWPKPFDEDKRQAVLEILNYVNQSMEGPLGITPKAEKYGEAFYDGKSEITDQRFTHYEDRRYTHFLKLSLILAVSRGSQEIDVQDCALAQKILRATELGMPDAIGMYGLNPTSKVKQTIMDYLQKQTGPTDPVAIYQLCSGDARVADIAAILTELQAANQIQKTSTPDGKEYYTAIRRRQKTEQQILAVLKALDD